MVTEYTGIAEAADDIRRYLILNEQDLPEHLRDQMKKLTLTGVSPVQLTVAFVEAVYANKKDFKAAAKDKAAGAAVLAEAHGFHDMAEESRGSKVADLLRGKAMKEEDRPAVKEQFEKPLDLPPVEDTMPEPPALEEQE